MRHGALKGTRAHTHARARARARAHTHAQPEPTQQSELLTALLLLREGTLPVLVLVGAAPSEG